MAVNGKPKPAPTNPSSDAEVEALIGKGGSVANDSNEKPAPFSDKATTSFTLRVPRDILQRVDDHRNNQSYKVPRQQWIMEAVMQRLERDAQIPE